MRVWGPVATIPRQRSEQASIRLRVLRAAPAYEGERGPYSAGNADQKPVVGSSFHMFRPNADAYDVAEQALNARNSHGHFELPWYFERSGIIEYTRESNVRSFL